MQQHDNNSVLYCLGREEGSLASSLSIAVQKHETKRQQCVVEPQYVSKLTIEFARLC